MFALLHDEVWMPLLWLVSPAFRLHQRRVYAQSVHLDRHRGIVDASCWFCRAHAEQYLEMSEQDVPAVGWRECRALSRQRLTA